MIADTLPERLRLILHTPAGLPPRGEVQRLRSAVDTIPGVCAAQVRTGRLQPAGTPVVTVDYSSTGPTAPVDTLTGILAVIRTIFDDRVESISVDQEPDL
ncbi:hypothetical protein F8O07_06680 [Pseudoclavibacter sp. CFCC 13796]|uniref:hypothetical protein n=1 Tax=Pseudoclavibacter sp. CFCC 13796 TaxID=2615179 RepID=UPI00130105AB|nr:hypothetical protein [Pseudoclavibacter sp. CFCC 13796]KAB1661584.1 hypothetical protein F8O07_06680 [Pseudoclavibacter sp. CFCC 13796]